MRNCLVFLMWGALVSCSGTPPMHGGSVADKLTPSLHASASFNHFFEKLEAEARTKNLNAGLLRKAYKHKPAPLASVAKARKAQPEFKRSFEAYVGGMLSATRVQTGQHNMQQHQATLAQIAAQTGVPEGMMVALWALESNFGKNQGSSPIIPALVSLAYDSNRPEYFKAELFAALQLAEKENLNPQGWQGSWAGASGHCQFMPSNVLRYGRDGNSDGHINIWGLRGKQGEADIFASTAALLRANGWQSGQPWRVAAPSGITLKGVHVNERGLSDPLTTSQWQARGVPANLVQKSFSPSSKLRHYQPVPGGPAWLVGPNFQAILGWNMSSYFAYSALSLADILQNSVNK